MLMCEPYELDALLKQLDNNDDGGNQEVLSSLDKWAQSLDVFISNNIQVSYLMIARLLNSSEQKDTDCPPARLIISDCFISLENEPPFEKFI